MKNLTTLSKLSIVSTMMMFGLNIGVTNDGLQFGSPAKAWSPDCPIYTWQRVDINTNLTQGNCSYQNAYNTAAVISNYCDGNLARHYNYANSILAKKGRNWRFVYITEYKGGFSPKKWMIKRIY